MTKYINEPTVLRLKPEGMEKPDGSHYSNNDEGSESLSRDLATYESTLASQPTFLKIGDGWERFKENDTVDGSEVEISERWKPEQDHSHNSIYRSGIVYQPVMCAQLKHKEAGEESDATNIPDGEDDWFVGQKEYSREEVFKMLYTQRAMITNDLKTSCWDELPSVAKEIILNPRKPKF